MSRLVLFNKPYGVLSQYTDDSGRPTLKHYFPDDHIYPAGRLDFDSEGLLMLTDDGKLQQKISDPRFKLPKTYWAQVEGEISDEALAALRHGIPLKDGPTRPAKAERMKEPANLWPRDPPIRYRAAIPTSWLALTITEGRNRQVRRMTAAVGFPTLRLIRARIGEWTISGLQPGEWQETDPSSLKTAQAKTSSTARRPADRSPSAPPNAHPRR